MIPNNLTFWIYLKLGKIKEGEEHLLKAKNISEIYSGNKPTFYSNQYYIFNYVKDIYSNDELKKLLNLDFYKNNWVSLQ